MPKYIPKLRRGASSLEHADCANCPLAKKLIVPCSPASKKAKFIILGDSPSSLEEEEGGVFLGNNGKRLDKALNILGLNRDDIHLTNAIMCHPGKNLSATHTKKAMVCCRSRLLKELEETGSKNILVFGELAMRTITSKTKIFSWCGSLLKGTAFAVKTKRTRKEYSAGELADFSEYQIFPTFHPSFCEYSPSYSPVFLAHIQRASQLFSGTLQNWQWPSLCVDVGEEMLSELKTILAEELPLSIDIETHGVDPMTDAILCIGIANKNRAVCVPWKKYIIGWEESKKQGDSGKRPIFEKGISDYEGGAEIEAITLEILRSSIKKIYQNGAHDILGIKKQLKIDMTKEYYFDTLLAHAVLAPRLKHDLGFIAACELHAPRWKSEFKVSGDAKGLDVFVKRDGRELRLYCSKDAYITCALYYCLNPQLEAVDCLREENAHRLELMKISMKMRERGVLVNLEKRDEFQKIVQDKRDEALEELKRISGNSKFNPNALRQLHNLFFTELKIKPTKFTPSGSPSLDEEVLKGLLRQGGDIREAAKWVLTYRQWNKLLKTYITGLPITKENRVHANWKVYGTRTGRWSATGPALQTIQKSFKVGEEKRSLREMFIPDKGSYIIKADYCVAKDTQILTTDLRWKRADEVKKGDKLVAFPEKLSQRKHHFETATVLQNKKLRQPCVKIWTENGGYICVSEDHRLLHSDCSNSRSWVRAADLELGDNLNFLISPMKERRKTYDDGWLSGMFDGEAYFNGSSLFFYQYAGPVLTKVKQLLRKYCFKFKERRDKRTGVKELGLISRIEALAFLIQFRPRRFMPKSSKLWKGRQTWGYQGAKTRIIKIEKARKREVRAIKTTSGTFIANGFLSHNSQLELRIIALLSGDEKLIGAFNSGEDIHRNNASDILQKKQITSSERSMAKGFVYRLNYGGSLPELYKEFSVLYNFTYRRVKELYTNWFREHPQLKEWQSRQILSTIKNKYVECPLSGRRQYYLDGKVNPNEALNFPIQGTGSDVIDGAIKAIDKEINWTDEIIILQVHDEIVLCGSNLLKLFHLMKEYMEREVELKGQKIKFPIDVSIGTSWHDTIDVEDEKEIEAWLDEQKKGSKK